MRGPRAGDGRSSSVRSSSARRADRLRGRAARARNPILPFSLFDNPNRVAALIAILLSSMVMMCMAVFISLYLQGILKYTPLQSGLAVVPFAFGLGTAAAIASKLSLMVQPRWLVAAGGAVICAGCMYAWFIATDDPAYFPSIGLPSWSSVSVGLAVIPLTLSVVAGVDPTRSVRSRPSHRSPSNSAVQSVW